MAILINKELSLSGGIPIPPGTLLIPQVHFPLPTLIENAAGKWNGDYTRIITYDNLIFASKQSYQNLEQPITGIVEIPAGMFRNISKEEYTALMKKGELAEIWLVESLDILLGGNYCEIVDPFTK